MHACLKCQLHLRLCGIRKARSAFNTVLNKVRRCMLVKSAS
jgi:hypothetical protein